MDGGFHFANVENIVFHDWTCSRPISVARKPPVCPSFPQQLCHACFSVFQTHMFSAKVKSISPIKTSLFWGACQRQFHRFLNSTLGLSPWPISTFRRWSMDRGQPCRCELESWSSLIGFRGFAMFLFFLFAHVSPSNIFSCYGRAGGIGRDTFYRSMMWFWPHPTPFLFHVNMHPLPATLYSHT